jgi:hypothetical protein
VIARETVRTRLDCSFAAAGPAIFSTCVNMGVSSELRWWVVLARAALLVLLFHVIPAAGAGYAYAAPIHPLVAPMVMVGIIAVAVSLGVGLLLAAALVAARMRNLRRISYIAGGTGIFLTTFVLVTAANELVAAVVPG